MLPAQRVPAAARKRRPNRPPPPCCPRRAAGVHPQAWPLPLTLDTVREAEKNPVPLPVPVVPAVKRAAEGDAATGAGGGSVSAPLPTHSSPQTRGGLLRAGMLSRLCAGAWHGPLRLPHDPAAPAVLAGCQAPGARARRAFTR